ncbi:hypothetical protein [Sulfuricurvum sp.]|uniref:GHMP family kinase ATP-binding protein n=1 Tax=Sulfuricurvum sp. TaxID=2025608 RepID=UPI00356A7343
MVIKSVAPLRISFAGGGTDVPPFPEKYGGLVVSCTIDKYAHVSVNSSYDEDIKIEPLDYNITKRYKVNQHLEYNGELDLVKVVINHFKPLSGFDLIMKSDAPPGSGLGSSSALIVALIGAFAKMTNKTMTNYQVAQLAYILERRRLKISGGYQDHYSATFGGFNTITFFKDNIAVIPMSMSQELIKTIEHNSILCYTGGTRVSANIIDDQTTNVLKKDETVMDALCGTKRLANELSEALKHSDISNFGNILNEGWKMKRKFSKKMTNDDIDKLYSTAITNGALGGKLLGAGGGGYLFFYCDFGKKQNVIEALKLAGGNVVDFEFEPNGLKVI